MDVTLAVAVVRQGSEKTNIIMRLILFSFIYLAISIGNIVELFFYLYDLVSCLGVNLTMRTYLLFKTKILLTDILLAFGIFWLFCSSIERNSE
jgi:ABC-type transport system involved in Fe-S cluster assembly fused permease/ATPase subunit